VRIESEEDLVAFVMKYGELKLCEHGLAVTHIRETDVEFTEAWVPDGSSCRTWGVNGSVEAWFRWVACARALLTAAAAIQQDRPPSEDDWERLHAALAPGGSTGKEISGSVKDGGLVFAKACLGEYASMWLRMSGIRPRLDWYGGEQEFYLEGGVIGELGLQILQAVTNSSRLAVCSGCGLPYLRQGRRPQEGRRNYCPDCGVRAALRDAQRERRAKMRRTDGQAG
jgi:hypothetical protein